MKMISLFFLNALPHALSHHLTIEEIIKSLMPCRFIDHVNANITLKDTKRRNLITDQSQVSEMQIGVKQLCSSSPEVKCTQLV